MHLFPLSSFQYFRPPRLSLSARPNELSIISLADPAERSGRVKVGKKQHSQSFHLSSLVRKNWFPFSPSSSLSLSFLLPPKQVLRGKQSMTKGLQHKGGRGKSRSRFSFLFFLRSPFFFPLSSLPTVLLPLRSFPPPSYILSSFLPSFLPIAKAASCR